MAVMELGGWKVRGLAVDDEESGIKKVSKHLRRRRGHHGSTENCRFRQDARAWDGKERKRASEELWNSSQRNGTTSKPFLNDWAMELTMAVENVWTKEINNRSCIRKKKGLTISRISEFKMWSAHTQWWEGVGPVGPSGFPSPFNVVPSLPIRSPYRYQTSESPIARAGLSLTLSSPNPARILLSSAASTLGSHHFRSARQLEPVEGEFESPPLCFSVGDVNNCSNFQKSIDGLLHNPLTPRARKFACHQRHPSSLALRLSPLFYWSLWVSVSELTYLFQCSTDYHRSSWVRPMPLVTHCMSITSRGGSRPSRNPLVQYNKMATTGLFVNGEISWPYDGCVYGSSNVYQHDELGGYMTLTSTPFQMQRRQSIARLR